MRLLVAALLLANLAFWMWSQGWLDAVVGVSSLGEREPHRVERQVDPQRVRIVAAGDAAAVPAGVPTSPPRDPAPPTFETAASAAMTGACFEAGPFTPVEAVAAEAALVRAALPPGSWVDVRTERPGTWIVYLGRFAGREQMAQREDELRRLRVAFEPVRNAPDLEPGITLGSHDSRAAADAAQQQLEQRGVRGARVLAVAPPSTTHVLRVANADAALQAQLAALRLPALGAGFVRCAAPAAR